MADETKQPAAAPQQPEAQAQPAAQEQKPEQKAEVQAQPAAQAQKPEQKAEQKKIPRLPSAQKQAALSKKRNLTNKASRSATKTAITHAEDLITSGERNQAGEAAMAAIRSLDKAAAKGVIHPNNAARRKSRLMKKLNKAGKAA